MIYYHNLSQLLNLVMVEYASKPALRYAEIDYTFYELGKWVDSLAALLLSKGLRRGDVIAIGHDKQALSYALMLAANRLGVAYVNIDIASPFMRNNRMLEVVTPSLLFFDDLAYQAEMTELAKTRGCELLLLEKSLLPATSEADLALQHKYSRLVDGETIAYIMFTSGSTGIPKGVAVTHQNILHLIAWGHERFGISATDNFANLSPMYFDNSVFDFYVGLYSGASLTPIHRSLLTKPYELVSYVSEKTCTIWFSVPSALMYLMTMKAIAPGTLSFLRTIIFGGEGYPKVELKKLYDRFLGQAALVNVYGPTECTCICSAYTLTAEDFCDMNGLPMLGSLNPNFDYRILDENGCDAAEGELYLIGPNVAAGYFNDVERTNEAFQSITDVNRFMKRMYRTGDIVKEVEGLLHFIGRRDHQIKHLGYRIELEEIEQALIKIPQINQAVVIYLKTNTVYGKIIGFAASSEGVDENHLLSELRRILPAYMIPSRIIIKSELPKNPNGKVDRQKLQTLVSE